MVDTVLNPRRDKSGRSAKLTVVEQRFYTAVPRYEETIKRACGRSIIMLRSDIATSLVRGLEDLERDYEAARVDSAQLGRPLAELEARYGAAIVLVHLQILAKVNELEELAASGAPVLDVARLAENVAGLATKLAAIEAHASVATTGDLNEEERNKIRNFDNERFIRLAEAVQLRREAQATRSRLAEGLRDNQADLVERAMARMEEIATATERLSTEYDLRSEVQLDQFLRQLRELVRV